MPTLHFVQQTGSSLQSAQAGLKKYDHYSSFILIFRTLNSSFPLDLQHFWIFFSLDLFTNILRRKSMYSFECRLKIARDLTANVKPLYFLRYGQFSIRTCSKSRTKNNGLALSSSRDNTKTCTNISLNRFKYFLIIHIFLRCRLKYHSNMPVSFCVHEKLLFLASLVTHTSLTSE